MESDTDTMKAAKYVAIRIIEDSIKNKKKAGKIVDEIIKFGSKE